MSFLVIINARMYLICALATFGNANILDVATTEMLREIAHRYFSHVQCIVLISEKGEPLERVTIDEIPLDHITLGSKVGSVILQLEDNDTPNENMLGEGTQVFERLLINTFDAQCLGYIVQVLNPRAMIYSFNRAMRRTTQRIAKRYYFFLPSLVNEDMDVFAEELLSMDLHSMPNMVIARMQTLPEESYKYLKSNLLGKSKMTFSATTCRDSPFIEKITETGRKEQSSNYKENLTSFRFDLATHKFTGLDPYTEMFLDTWVQSTSGGHFVQNVDLYPNKIADLKGKPLTTIGGPSRPYMFLEGEVTPQFVDGTEKRIYQELAQKLNATTVEVEFDPEFLWGSTYDNGSANGLLGLTSLNCYDFGIGGVYWNWYNEWLWADYSFPHTRGRMQLFMPRPHLLSAYYVLILPFSLQMWVALLLSLVVVTACFFGFSAVQYKLFTGIYGPTFSLIGSFLDTVGMLVLQVPNKESSYPGLRQFITSCVIFFLLVASTYSGGLASVLTSPRYEPPINTVAEVAKRNILWAAPHEAYCFSIQNSDNPALKVLVRNFRKMPMEELAIEAEKGHMGFILEPVASGSFAIEPYLTKEKTLSQLRLMKEHLYWGYVVLVTPKSSPYMGVLNSLILDLNKAGIVYFWENLLTREFSSTRLRTLIYLGANDKDLDGDDPKILRVAHLQGAFILLFIGSVTAAIVFIVEVCWERCQ